jgi:AAHS family 4-hydroxybenzoate transporter-like MFS transporter
MARPGKVLNIQEFIDEKPFSAFQWLVLGLCFLTVATDGFDTAAVGFVAPSLVKAWGVARPALAPVLTAALVGLAVGALTAGPLADRFGRKVVLVTSVLLFGGFTIASAFADSITTLTVLRFLTGLGLGAAMPNATTLMSEFCPGRSRSLFVTLMFCGFTLGSALGGFIAAALIPRFGWPSVFFTGGGSALVLASLLILLLPESVRFLVTSGKAPARIRAILGRIARDPALDAAETFVTPEQQFGRKKNSVAGILAQPFTVGTVLLWATYFSGLVVIYLLTSWLPTLMNKVGFSISTSALVTSCFQLGGTGGALLVSWAMDRLKRPHMVMAVTYLLGGAMTFLVGRASGNTALLAAAVLGAGFFMSGAQTPLAALGAAFSPTQVRATGVSWMMGIGRFGGILGAAIGGTLLPLGFPTIFTLLAIPAVVACLAMALKGHLYRHDPTSGGRNA